MHLITHTHDDVGWLKTVDEYFSGTDQDTAIAEVHLILSSVVDALIKDPAKKFTYVEMKFFQMWWERQTPDLQDQVRQLVDEHRLEFVNAGWSMHDEACTHHDDMMNNMMKGHEFLYDTFGYKPSIGWHIDPFGHSNANPRLFADMGFDAWFFGRLDYQDRDNRLDDRGMQFLWRPMYDSLGESVEIFTSVLQDMYWWPVDLGYDERDVDSEAIISNPKYTTFNAD